MASANPFRLPDEVLDAASARLGERPTADREQGLAELIARFPTHEGPLREFARALGDADRMLGATFAMVPTEPVAEPPHFVGYRVIRRLGEGAFGVVYLCEQQALVQRRVAIKLLRPGAGDRGTFLRFEAERRFLARLRHPAIAQIFDVGSLRDGRPWFVMEHVDGVPIAAFCDREFMSIEARLRLFVRLCHGVQHAHEQGIVHRDLKPSNVLVVVVDGEAQPKVIDFGIARALQSGADDATPRTETGRIVGTPGYMSPEQAEGRLAEIDARSDVWSLGAMLFELLTGTLPLGSRPQSTDTDPVRPSQRLAAEPALLADRAGRRGTDARRLAATVRGELDWIVGKALARDRELRYPSVHELAADLLRHLRGERVHAGPPPPGYRLRKFTRRHRTGLAVAAGSALLSAIGVPLILTLLDRAATNSEQAEAAVQALLRRANDPQLIRAATGNATRRALAQDALAFYDRWLRERPRDAAAASGRASCLSTLSQVHWLLGNSVRSAELAQEAIAAFAELLAAAPDDGVLLRGSGLSYWRLGRALREHGVGPAPPTALQRAVDLLEQAHARQAPDTAPLLVDALRLHASCAKPEVAAVALARAEDLQRQVCAADPEPAEHHEALVALLADRAFHEMARGEVDAATARLQQAEELAAQRAVEFGVRHQLSRSRAYCALAAGSAAAVAAAQQWVDDALAWREAQPDRVAAHASAAMSLSLLSGMQREAGLPWHATTHQAVDVATAWIDAFPEHPPARFAVAAALLPLCYEALTTGHRADLAAPMMLATRACAYLAPSPALPEPRRSREAWRIEGVLGIFADALAATGGGAIWDACGRTLVRAFGDQPPPGNEPFAIDLGNRIVRSSLASGRQETADEWLTRLAAWQRAAGAPPYALPAALQTTQLRVAAATRRSAWAEAEELVEELAAAATGWRSAVAAAEAMSLAYAAARVAKLDRAAAMRDRALELCNLAAELLAPSLAAEPDDPWLIEPSLRLRLRRALLVADSGGLVDAASLADAIAGYEALGADVFADTWDGTLLAAARQLQDR